VGSITGSTGFIIGDYGQVTVNQGSGTHDELAKQFAQIYQQITQEPEAFQELLNDTVKSIQEECAKGPQADVKNINGK
jgi:alanyl-tRNA synthetase